MRASILRQIRTFLGASVGAGLLLGIGSPAQARGLVADDFAPTTLLSPGSTCSLGSACGVSISFGGANIYVYTDGAISFGGPPSNPVLGDLSTFGNNYIAAGLADYSALDMGVWEYQSGNILQLSWIFTVPGTGGKEGLFGIDLTDLGGGKFAAEIGSGGDAFTWFGSTPVSPFNPYCDSLCQGDSGDPFAVYGVYLPNNALIGSSFSATDVDTSATLNGPWDVQVTDNTTYTYPNYTLNFSLGATISAPEPAGWATMGFGLGAMAMMLRRRRKRTATTWEH